MLRFSCVLLVDAVGGFHDNSLGKARAKHLTSYTIRRLWKKIRPRDPSSVPAPIQPLPQSTSSKKIVLANRVDGLGERLCAIMNAIRLAAHLDVDFRFTWSNELWNDAYDKTVSTAPAKMFGHSIVPIEQIFASEFIEKYACLECADSDFAPVPKTNLTTNALSRSALRGWYTTQHHLATEYGAPFANTCKLSSSDAFSQIKFTDETEAAVQQARSLDLGDFVAIHLRSGDMVYGDVRKWGFWGNKVLNPIIAFDMIKQANARGQKVVVFGQDLDWLRHIKSEHDIIVAHDLLGTEIVQPHMRALFEMVLMARATQIISGDSGFARAASMIGDKTITSMFSAYSPIRYSDLTLAGIDELQKNLHPCMIAYAYWQAYAFGRTLRSVPQLIDIIKRAHRLDPENYLYMIILVALKYRLGQDSDAEAILEKHYRLHALDFKSPHHPVNKQIVFRYITPKYTHEEQFADFTAAARRPGNHHAKYIADLIRGHQS